MAADDFFSRWSKSNSALDHQAQQTTASPVVKQSPTVTSAEPAPPPTLDEVEKLTHDSDFSRFVGRDVDETVKRSALKKLFSDPHFNVMDGLDIYIDDYNKFTPLTPVMLASLKHAQSLLNPKNTGRSDLLSQDEEQGSQEPSLPAASDDAAASENASSDGEQHAGPAGEGPAIAAAEQSPSKELADEPASPIEVNDKPLSQGGS